MELVRSLLPGPALYDDGEAIVWGDPDAPIALAGHRRHGAGAGEHPGPDRRRRRCMVSARAT